MGGGRGTYAADEALVLGEMGFAVLAAVDLVAGEVVVVYQTHGCGLARRALEGVRCASRWCREVKLEQSSSGEPSRSLLSEA